MKYNQHLLHYISGLFGSLILSLATHIFANPSGPQVVHGQVTMSHPNPATLNIRNSPNAIINWKSFSVGKGETTRFIQNNASSAILNRVSGVDPSALLGRLSSNGRVFLINPNGMVFGPNAVIDTAGFIGSTLNIKDDDFLAGRLNFEGAAGAGSIENQGLIQARDDGGVYLIAPRIENSGIIRTERGNLVLAAGRKITISSLDLNHISFEIQAPEDEVVNIGKLLTRGGAMGVFAGTIRNHGQIEADTLTRDAQGNIRLVAQAGIELDTGSTINASSSRGGRVHIESKTGTTRVSGTIEAKGIVDNGGEVQLLGEHVVLNNTSSIDVSGERGGGTVLVGGDYKGQGEVRNATTTYVGPDVVINAGAETEGDGGKVIVWADDSTRYYGDIAARGGDLGGDGGFVEVSGKKNLSFDGTVDASAPDGNIGTLLLDPFDITVEAGNSSNNDPNLEDDPRGQIRADESPDSSFFISQGALEDLPENTDVILQATNDITIENMSNQILELMVTSDGSVTFTADADQDGAGTFSVAVSNTIQTQGGAITIEGASIIPGNIDTNGPPGSGSINSGAVTLTSSGDGQLIAGNIDTSSTAGGGGDITISATGNIFTGNLNSSGSTNSAGVGGDIAISTTGNISTENMNSSASTKAGNISLESSSGNIDLFGDGIDTVIPDVDATSSNGVGGNIRLTAAQNVIINGNINANGQTKSGDISLTGNEIDLAGASIQSFGGDLLLQPALPDQNIVVAAIQDTGEALDILATDLESLASTFNAISIGHIDGTGIVTNVPSGVIFDKNYIFQSPGNGGSIVINGPVQTGGSDIKMIAGDGITLQGGIDTQGGAVTIGGANISTIESVDIQTTGGDITINTTGDIATNGGSLELNTSATTNAGAVAITSESGSVTFRNINSVSMAGEGGDIVISATDGISAGNVNSSGFSQAGEISLNSTNGNISVEDAKGIVVDATSSMGTGGNISLTAGFLELFDSNINASGQASSGNIILTGNGIDLTGSVVRSSSANLLLQPVSLDQDIIVGAKSVADKPGILDITSSVLASLANDFNTITIGHKEGSGAVTIAPDAPDFDKHFIIQSPDPGGTITAGRIVRTGGSDLEMIAGDRISLPGGMDTRGGNINLSSMGKIAGLNLNASSVSDTGGSITITGNQLDLAGSLQTKSAAIALSGNTINLAGIVESSGPEGKISVNGPVQTSGNDLRMTAGNSIAINADIISSGGDIELNGTNIGLFTATLDSTNPDSGSGAINLAPTMGGNINVDNSTLITDLLTLGGPVSGTSLLALLPATTGKDINMGSPTDTLMSAANIDALSTFAGHLSVGGTIAPPAVSTQVKAGNITVVSDISIKGDLTLVSLGDITVNSKGSLQSDGTLTLAALGDFIPGSPGNISDTNTSEARFFFDAPEVIFFANNEAGTLENPLTVKSGTTTVNVGAGTGVAYFDGAPGNIIGSGPVIQSMFESFQAAEINLDKDILNTKVEVIPPEPRTICSDCVNPIYPPILPEPPPEADDTESGESQWNSEVSQVATLDQWMITGPRFPYVIDMSNLHMDTLIVPNATVVAYFRPLKESANPADKQPDISKTVFTFSLSTNGSTFYTSEPVVSEPGNGLHRVTVRVPENLEQLSERGSIVEFSMAATGGDGKPAPIHLVSIASYTASTGQDSAKVTTNADDIAPNIKAMHIPLRMVSLQPDTENTRYIPVGYVVPGTGIQFFDAGTTTASLMVATNGDGLTTDIDAATLSSESVAHGIDHISFGPPTLIYQGESTEYSFHTLDDFTQAELVFRTVQTQQNKSKYVSSERLQGIRKGDWVGKDGNRRWDGLNEEGQLSIGDHELQINAWNRQDIVWQSRWSDKSVTVSSGD